MAGSKPSFITGATAKIKIGNLTMAYSQDVSYNTTITTIPVEVMGAYEVKSNEPVAYFVTGTLSIVRYTSAASASGVASVTTVTPGGTTISTTGNSVEQMKNSGNEGGTAGDGFDPYRMISSETFDLEIFQKVPGTTAGVLDTLSIVKLRDCRFTSKGGSINKRGILVEQFAFNAILMNNDAEVEVGHSGDDDLT